MKVLFVISELTFGGAQKQLVELSRQLDREGHEVTIYTLNNDVPRKPELDGSGVTLIVDQKRAKLDVRVLWRLRRLIWRWKPDIVHSFLFDADVYSRLAAIGTGIPVLNSERSSHYTLSRVQRIAHRITEKLASGVVANSWCGKAFAEGMYRMREDDIHVVWNGLELDQIERQSGTDADFRKEFFGPGEHRIACLVGAIKPAKDYPLALETARHLLASDPRWRVLLIGDQLSTTRAYKAGRNSDTGGYKERVLAQYESMADRDRIRFAGNRADVHAVVRQCDVLYVTSVLEGFPNSVLEAMAVGVPVVSTEYSDIRRILPFAEQVIASRSAEELALAIEWAHANHDLIAERQRQWVRQNASIEKAAADLERVYRRYIRQDVYALGAQ
jgi:glycosyltransferase involved in cell wall biosynthesis